ncbi:polyprenyl synthetase family protein [Estrella lausannensis]|uniref:Geranyltranstransferase n=1 Tax=Estrella lausannensis TaxID=483423 RepID=A0A0H5E2X7_9BACT|nr:polyprenyl synthetase family protein [Estrella lausannensis]CRX37555.1 geranyltranstransferase [Estrella lausannensis]
MENRQASVKSADPSKMKLDTLLAPYQKRIESAIEQHVQAMGPKNILKDACAYVLATPGKRLRPALVLMVQEMLKPSFDAMSSALAIEFFHTASLIADDLPCMDDDDERRNRPSAHKKFGEATALLASYALIAEGYGLIAKNAAALPSKQDSVLQLALENSTFNTGIFGATGGQLYDLMPPDRSEATIRRIIHMKTTSLFEISFVFGWLFGGGDLDRLEDIKKTASHFGLGFQILDDLDDYERDLRERGLNIAVELGIQKTKDLFASEMDAFRKSLRHLGIDSRALLTLADIMESSISSD